MVQALDAERFHLAPPLNQIRVWGHSAEDKWFLPLLHLLNAGYEGTINQFLGDGFMALFGAPVAHEDHARRALLAASGIQQRLRDTAEGVVSLREVRVRMGVNTGMVVVGKIGDNLRMDYTAVGDTTNLAARLQQHARPGSVVISAATHRQVAGFFETLDLGEIPMKGRAPSRVFEVLRPRGRRARL